MKISNAVTSKTRYSCDWSRLRGEHDMSWLCTGCNRLEIWQRFKYFSVAHHEGVWWRAWS